jgi:hypothetical protein
MGEIFFILLALVFLVGIAASTGGSRMIWLLVGVLFIQDRVILIEIPIAISFQRFLIYFFGISILVTGRRLRLELRQFPLLIPLFCVCIGLILNALFDGRHGILLNLYRVLDHFIQTFLLILVCYLGHELTDNNRLWRFFSIAAIVISIYGIFSFITKSNPYDAFISATYDSFSFFDHYAELNGRFRVSAFESHPISFGYISGLLLILSIFTFYTVSSSRLYAIISGVLAISGLVFSNSRTPMIACILGIMALAVAGLPLRAKLNVLFLGTLVAAVLVVSEIGQERMRTVFDAFSEGGGQTEGSSLDMRLTQLSASVKEFQKKPLSGNGFNYIHENLGWANDVDDSMIDSELQGFESYLYQLLIEQGVIGLATNAAFFISLIMFFWKTRSYTKELSALGLSACLMFLTFILGTGPLNSWAITMSLLGITIKSVSQEIAEIRSITPANIRQEK